MGQKLRIEEMNRLNEAEFRDSQKIPVIVALDNVRSMHNVGAVFRTADCFRIEKIILGGFTPVPPHREITKTAIGAESTVTWEHHQDLQPVIESLSKEGYTVCSLEQVHDSTILNNYPVNIQHKYVLLLGHEIKGVSQDLIDLSDVSLEIPQYGTKHSLNVSVAAGIALHHLSMGFWLSSTND